LYFYNNNFVTRYFSTLVTSSHIC